MEFVVEARNTKHKRWVEALLPSMLKQLGLTQSRKTVLITVEPCDGAGATYPLDPIDS
jgi:hypothetical protein